MNRNPVCVWTWPIGVPRASGDEPGRPGELAIIDECSPRERG